MQPICSAVLPLLPIFPFGVFRLDAWPVGDSLARDQTVLTAGSLIWPTRRKALPGWTPFQCGPPFQAHSTDWNSLEQRGCLARVQGADASEDVARTALG